MAPKRTSTSAAPAMNQAAIGKLVADSVVEALETQAATMANTDNTNRNTEQRETLVARKCSYKEFMSCQPFNFKGADKSFVSISLASMLNIPSITLDTTYDIEMANGNLVGTNTVIQGCTLILLNQPFKIDLMLIKLGSFDIVIGMDWLSKYHARIICGEKVVHIPIDGETLIILGDQRAAPVAQAPYILALSAMQELSDQHQELADRGKANVVADALSQKERIKPLRDRALVMTLHPKLPSQILEAQNEAIKEEKIEAENLRGMDKAFKVHTDGT
nr:reverse transcriptase domain-containing protein [Tanacetum cinerariifolium]